MLGRHNIKEGKKGKNANKHIAFCAKRGKA